MQRAFAAIAAENPELTPMSRIKVAVLLGIAGVFILFFLVYGLLPNPSPRPDQLLALQPIAPTVTRRATAVVEQATATATATAAAAITAIATHAPYIHSAAGINTRRIGVLPQGQRAEVLGRSPDSLWLEIRYPEASQRVGWIWAAYVRLTRPGAVIPVVASP
jgi:hypothetical protein